MRLRNPLARARNHGAAGHAVGHWWTQRLTAIVLVPLTLWVVWAMLALIGADHAAAAAWLGRPWNAVMGLVFVGALFWHAQLGLQVVIEDYVHRRGLEVSLHILIKILAVAGALAGAVAILKLAVGV